MLSLPFFRTSSRGIGKVLEITGEGVAIPEPSTSSATLTNMAVEAGRHHRDHRRRARWWWTTCTTMRGIPKDEIRKRASSPAIPMPSTSTPSSIDLGDRSNR